MKLFTFEKNLLLQPQTIFLKLHKKEQHNGAKKIIDKKSVITVRFTRDSSRLRLKNCFALSTANKFFSSRTEEKVKNTTKKKTTEKKAKK